MASKANEKRIAVTLECTQCKRRNYITQKNKVNDRERIEMKKYCRWDRTHTRAQGDPLTGSATERIDEPVGPEGDALGPAARNPLGRSGVRSPRHDR